MARSIPLYKGTGKGRKQVVQVGAMLVSDIDYPQLSRFRWFAMTSRGRYTTYAVRRVTVNGRTRSILAHREILGFGSRRTHPQLVDHSDGDGTNNTRENLRSSTPSQNRANSRTRRNSRSGYKGVWKQRNGQFRAILCWRKKRYKLGTYRTSHEGAYAVRCAALTIHGEYARPTPIPPEHMPDLLGMIRIELQVARSLRQQMGKLYPPRRTKAREEPRNADPQEPRQET